MVGRVLVPLSLLCALALMVGLAACGGDDDDGEAAEEPVQLVMLNSGSQTDSSWTQSWFEGSQQAQEALGDQAEVTYTDNLNSVDALDRAGGAALQEGASTLIYATGEVPDSVTKYAQRFPDAFVCDVSPPRDEYPENLCTIEPEMQDGAFLAGALAALTTEAGHVGAVAGIEIPSQVRQVEGFALGVRYIDPDIRVEQVFTQSLTDPARARAAADAQFSAGADIILSAVDEANPGIEAAAQSHDGWVIFQYTDQYETYPDITLTSVQYRLNDIGEEMLTLAANGELEGRAYLFGLEDSNVGELAPIRGAAEDVVSQEALDRVAELEEQIRNGELVIPDVTVLGTSGAADDVDLETLEAGS